ncbi:hypothetical protein MMC25_000607 [Agyrium rufum]|nr:hypothetical protein [Agyrium rufum]
MPGLATNPKRPYQSDDSHPPKSFSTTIRSLPFTYLHISLFSAASDPPPSSVTGSSTFTRRPDPIDEITVRTYLTSALKQFLGLTGTAIPVDILKVDQQDAWVRVSRGDGKAVMEALSGWVGTSDVAWRVKGRGDWLGGVVMGDGRALFED